MMHNDNLQNAGMDHQLMDDKIGDILTIEELAAYLRIPKSTLYKLVREGKVPSQKIGRHWRFLKNAVDRWLEKNAKGNNSRDVY